MCGIAGLAYGGLTSISAALNVRRMIALQHHRGPDGEGFYDAPGVSLGHCRLAIIDTSAAGHQPMADPSGRYWITYNGEIYNYVELASELKKLGHVFRGRSDTEVLLAAYVHWGSECLERLRGMFAFAIWDNRERSLFAARDRLGIKPFHYCVTPRERFAFSSELKALLQFLPERRANAQLANDFLAWNLLEHEAADTLLADVRRLPAAHSLTWRAGEEIKLERYWSLRVNDELSTPPARRAAFINEFRRQFEESVQLHLRSDVPVGSCLSGGLDSSAIVSVVDNELRRDGHWQEGWQQSFSACFDVPAIDERPFIENVIEATGCESHYVFPTGQQLSEEIDTWLWHQEEPVGGTGTYAHYCVARLAKEHGIKVLLDGQGADEQLAGYRKFILVYVRELMRGGHYAQAAWEALTYFSSPAILRTSDLSHGRRYFQKSVSEVEEIWPANQPRRPASLGLQDSFARRIEADLQRFSLPTLLRYEDRNTMAFGIESRVPYVDHVFVEWLATLPADMRLAGGWTKWIMREALTGVLPEKIRTRKSKLGFATPFSAWMVGPLSQWLRDTLAAPKHLSDIIDLKGVRSLLHRYDSEDHSASLLNMLFRCAVYETWASQFLAPSLPVTKNDAAVAAAASAIFPSSKRAQIDHRAACL